MAKKKAEAEPASEYEVLPVDVCGQPGGPSPEEQARVDAEQLEFMERRKSEWKAAKDDERAKGVDVGSKVEKAARAPRILTADLLKRIEALEAKTNG